MTNAQAQAIRQLLSDAREEQKKGIEFFYRVERPKVFNKFATYCTPAELEELFDDALILFLKQVTFVKKNPIAYFWQICRNKIYDCYRSKQQTNLVLTEEEELIQLQDQSIELEAPNFEIDAEQASQYAIQHLMNQLGNEDRKVLIRRYFQNWSNQDIAEEEKIAKQSVATKLYRILQKLRKILDNEPWLKEILEAQLYEEAFQSN